VVAMGVDVGTGSVRAYLFDESGRRLGGVRLGYEWRHTPDGGAEVDPDLLVGLVEMAIDGALSVALPPDTLVEAVGISALWHTLLGVGDDDAPTTPAFGWNDARATAAAAVLRERLDVQAVHARTGAMLHPSYPPAKLLWLRETRPGLFRATRRWLSIPEYLWRRLCGERAVDISIAAGSGLLDQTRCRWDAELLDALGVEPDQLSPVAAKADRSIRPEGGFAAGGKRWPQLRAARWRIPAGDGACATIGSGCGDGTRVALSIGTSAALRVLRNGGYAPPPDGLWCYRTGEDHVLLGAASSNGGLVPTWLRRTLRLPADGAELDALLARRPPAGHGLTMLPFFAGERSPDWPLDVAATLSGMHTTTSPLDILQAGLEAVTYRVVLLRERLRQAAPEAGQIVASGAAFEHLPGWAQLLADVMGEPILLSGEMEASAWGAAMVALTGAGAGAGGGAGRGGAGWRGDAGTGGGVGVLVEPDMSRHAAHREAMARQVELTRRLGV
jgi:gluconokinase